MMPINDDCLSAQDVLGHGPGHPHQENHFVIQAFPGLQAISQGTSGTLGCPVMPCDALQHIWYSMAYCILLIFTTTLITRILFPLKGFSQ
jgi:hypothetical protein